MTDLDSFRTALRAPLDRDLGPVDLDRVIVSGRRLRRLRRLAGAGAVAAATVAVLAVSFVATGPAPAPVQPPATAPASPNWGEVIPTGIEDRGQERVFYVVALPVGRFGVMAGRRDGHGGLTGDVLTNEVAAADRADGFHAVWGGVGPDGTTVPVFGYYVGPAASITATVHGRPVRAARAAWSDDPRVVVFWFDNPGGPIADLAAFDAEGERLPTGDTAIYVG